MPHSNKSKPRPKVSRSSQRSGLHYTFEAIGTVWTIDTYEPISDGASKKLQRDIRERIDAFDRVYSRFRDDSLVSSMATQKGRYRLPDDAKPMMNLYRQLYDLTDGVMTPLIGQVLSDAGYDADYSLRPATLTSPPTWEEVLDYHAPELILKQPALLDFGAAGKGYLVDIIGTLLESNGLQTYCIDAGGDILYNTDSENSIRIGLEHPGDSSLVIGVATIRNQSICGSAGNRRTWGQYHHIISSKSLTSPRHIQAIWVMSDTGLFSDGLATALFFAPPAKLMQHFSFEYAIINEDYSLEHSKDFPAVFYAK